MRLKDALFQLFCWTGIATGVLVALTIAATMLREVPNGLWIALALSVIGAVITGKK